MCEERNLPLVTHVGAAGTVKYARRRCDGDHVVRVGQLHNRIAAAWWLVFAGVIERFPRPKLVITETPGNRLPAPAEELDALETCSRRNRS